MSGPALEKVSASQDLLGKKIAELVDGELTFAPQGDGKTVKVTGKAKNITEPWTSFSTTDNTGYFVAFYLPKDFVGHKVTISGGAHDKTFDSLPEADRLLITRLDGYLDKESKQTFTVDSTVKLIVDYTGITKEG